MTGNMGFVVDKVAFCHVFSVLQSLLLILIPQTGTWTLIVLSSVLYKLDSDGILK